MLGQSIDPEAVKDMATQRFVARRMSELREIYNTSKARISELRRPIGPSAAAVAAEGKAEKSERDAEKAKEAAENAAARLAAIEADAPQGWRRWLAWLTGRLRRHKKRCAKASEALEVKQQHHRARKMIARSDRDAYEEQVKQDKARRATEMAARSEQEQEAMATMEQVRLGADRLRRAPGMASQSVADLLHFGETERRRRLTAAKEDEAKIAASSRFSAPCPTMC